jgi:FkbH-like protein
VDRLVAGHTQPRDNRFGDPADVFKRRTDEGLELLIKCLAGEAAFGELYVGQRNFELFRLELSVAANLELARGAVAQDKAVLRAFLEPRVKPQELTAFEHAFDAVTAPLVVEATRHVRTLFIGDCYLGEILSFLVSPLMREGLSIEPFPINPRDKRQLADALDSMSTKTFDVIFFSPFSHARQAEIEALMKVSSTFASTRKLHGWIDDILDQTKTLLDELSRRFECPIYVHNAALLPRATSPASAYGRLALTWRARHAAGQRINRWLADYVSLQQANRFPQLFVIDENALAEREGRANLGRFLHTSEFQHATALSRAMAREYHERIGAVSRLMGRKLVICDLDNTLWDGVIGEGAVTHFEQRQASLKRLKDSSGIVLSIASKNDPANVHFDGGVLAMSDFVAPQISWGSKAAAIEKIKNSLNLQTRHMVFIDDRPDERAMAREAFPDLLALDACDPVTWRMIDHWGHMTFGSSDVDRTRMYQEQALRDAAIQSDGDTPQSVDFKVLEKLGLVISVGPAKKKDLKRIAELINRTNQWNLCGSRTNFEQVRAWSESDQAHVLIANAADRFGDMGTVCVAVVTESEQVAEIPIFVLSCRVFGYGVETAMLNDIATRCGVGSKGKSLVGEYRPNTQNHPCKNMYADHGFAFEADRFRWNGASAMPSVPWAEIRAL